jgi:hypothetical protein
VGLVVVIGAPLLILSFIKCGQRVQRRKKLEEVGSQVDIMMKRVQQRINVREQVVMWIFTAICMTFFILLLIGIITF